MSGPIEILLVEDNPADAKLTVAAFQNTKIVNNISVVHDGEEALSFLHKRGKYSQARSPHLILLDLNLPGKSGHDVLEEIKNNPTLKRIPVVILSSSDDQRDIARTYDNYANCFITKPTDLPGFFDIVKAIEDFWFARVTLPLSPPL